MNLRTLVPFILTAVVLAACSGAGSNSTPANSTPMKSAAMATGTMTFTVPQTHSATNNARKPSYISSATTHAALFIDGATTAAGSTACPSTCTLSWTSSEGTHSFAAEIDGATFVLAEGVRTYILIGGANGTLSPALTLNGAVDLIVFTPVTCSGSSCSGPFDVYDAGKPVITSAGGSTSFDNGPFSFSTSNPSVGTVTPTTLTSPNPTGEYAFAVGCVSGQTGSFTIVVQPPTPSGDVTALELATVSVFLQYPSNLSVTTNTYTCTGGVISTGSSSGTVTVQ